MWVERTNPAKSAHAVSLCHRGSCDLAATIALFNRITVKSLKPTRTWPFVSVHLLAGGGT
jgi:hypothetical protein